MLYIYFGRLEDGCWWFIRGSWIRKVVYVGGKIKTTIRNVYKIADALRDKVLLRSLPKTLQQYLRQHSQELLEKLEKAIDTIDRVLLLLEKVPVTCLEKAISRMRARERARISETLLDEAYEAKAVLEETVTLLEKLEQED